MSMLQEYQDALAVCRAHDEPVSFTVPYAGSATDYAYLRDYITRANPHVATARLDGATLAYEGRIADWQLGASYDYLNRPRRQDIPAADRRYRETGSLYLTRRDPFMETNNRLAGSVGLFMMDEREGWEIDTATDFAVLETLIKEDLLA